ncbi:murein hydrolase activator EnvC family protein [Heliorestis convoluta]|uniref:Peptidase family M23 n=1 Tax=Heliorestis convoluta TaxID=356322 RepID=A0A5Q2N1T5_9FIRM|nr:M23 family metallopeptidase [Heliorestis convoluta]QGG47252.1 Peptidase family M23 [Heliorestis convoluta]
MKKSELEKWVYNRRRTTKKKNRKDLQGGEERRGGDDVPAQLQESWFPSKSASKSGTSSSASSGNSTDSKDALGSSTSHKSSPSGGLGKKSKWSSYEGRFDRIMSSNSDLSASSNSFPNRSKSPWRLVGQSVIALLLFFSLWGLFQLEHPWAKVAQVQVERIVSEDMEFEPLRQAVLRLGLWTDGTTAMPVFSPNGAVARYGLPVEEPVKGIVVEAFGQRGVDFYPGVRIVGTAGAPVRAAVSGTLITSWSEDGGIYVQIAANDGSTRIMGPLQELYVEAGEKVEAQTVIGPLGRSASAGQAQLYLEVRHEGRSVDPLAPGVQKGGAPDENSPTGGGGNSNQ